MRWAFLEGDELLPPVRALHGGNAGFLTAWGGGPRPTRVMVAAVASGDLVATLAEWVRDKWQLEIELIVASDQLLGVTNGYRNFAALGVDRWLGLLAARGLAGGSPACVVDFGTALTVDLLTGDGRHLGGTILPGIRSVRASLASQTARVAIPEWEETPPRTGPYGRDTSEAVNAGILESAAGLVERSASHLSEIAGVKPVCYVTGGDGKLLVDRVRLSCEYRPNLVLEGLARMARMRAH